MAAATACLAACTSVVGLDDLSFRAAGGMTAGGSSSTSGGDGGDGGDGTTSSPSGGNGGTTPTGAGGGGGVGTCHPQDLVDDFDDGVLNVGLWVPWFTNGATVGEDSGVAWMQPAASVADISFSDISSKHLHDLRNCSTWVEVVQVLEATTPGQTFLAARQDPDNELRVLASEGELKIELRVDGTLTQSASSPYAPSTQRWWRFREEMGTLHVETSPDGISWNEQAALPTPGWFTEVSISIGAGTWQAAPSPGRASFDNFNLPP